MSNNSNLETRKNKKFVVDNKHFLKQYALKNNEAFGRGIIVVNLLLLKTDTINKEDLVNNELVGEQDQTVHQPVSYIPQNNFWFKMIGLKIKKKYQIDIQDRNSYDRKFLIVFIKDPSIEYFSIYSLKL